MAERQPTMEDVTLLGGAIRALLTERDHFEAALREIVRREAVSDYSSIYAAPGEFAELAREALETPGPLEPGETLHLDRCALPGDHEGPCGPNAAAEETR